LESFKIEETINQRIMRYRKALGFSQAEMSDYLDMKRSTYSQKEREGEIDCSTIIKISEILGVDVKILLYGENPSKKATINSSFSVSSQERRLIEALRNIKPQYRDLIYTITGALIRSE